MKKSNSFSAAPGSISRAWERWSVALLLLLGASGVQAFPPAPHHLIYGMARDEFGTPISAKGARIILETSAGIKVMTTIIPGLRPGVNYELAVPMDAGLTSDLYKPTALQPTVPFKIKVKIGSVIYLPIEMSGSYALLGQPGQRSLLNLTLGEDSDNDGLPDAWERLINSDLSKVTPGGDSDSDRMTNLQEYLAGTYAFDPADGFKLTITGTTNGKPRMKFLAINGRNYALLGSTDLKTWVAVGFRIPAQDAADIVRQNYQATDVRTLEIEATASVNQPAPTFFKLVLQ